MGSVGKNLFAFEQTIKPASRWIIPTHIVIVKNISTQVPLEEAVMFLYGSFSF